VSDFTDFEYQVIFSHAGMYQKSGATFEYPPPMAKWIDALLPTDTLDAELKAYSERFGGKEIIGLSLPPAKQPGPPGED
jgi:hypothetical protein